MKLSELRHNTGVKITSVISIILLGFTLLFLILFFIFGVQAVFQLIFIHSFFIFLGLLLYIKIKNYQLKQSIEDLSLLNQISETLGSSLEENEMILSLGQIFKKRLQLNDYCLAFINDQGELEVKVHEGYLQNCCKQINFEQNHQNWIQAIRNKKTLFISDIQKVDPQFFSDKRQLKTGSFLSCPLILGERVIGILNCGHPEKNYFSALDLQFMESFANQIALAYDRSQLYSKTKQLSVKDELTGLYNRRYFQQTLQMEWKRSSRFVQSLSLLMIDVDHFKQYNDHFGHLNGDRVLKNIAKVLSQNIREIDTVARFGGEEFVILLVDTPYADAILVAEKIRKLVESSNFNISNNSIQITVSIGLASAPEQADDPESLLELADIALYQAKDRGRNCIVAYSDTENPGPRSNYKKIMN